MDEDFTTIRIRKETRERLRKEIQSNIQLSDGDRIQIALNERKECKKK